MAKKRLTDRTLQSLKPATSKRRHYDIWDDLIQGFGVRVNQDGRRTFILMARYPGSRHPTRRALGQYENGMTLETYPPSPTPSSPPIVDPAPTPLPSSWFLLLSGFVGLGFLAYHRVKSNSTAIAAA